MRILHRFIRLLLAFAIAGAPVALGANARSQVHDCMGKQTQECPCAKHHKSCPQAVCKLNCATIAVLPAHPVDLGGVYSAPRETAEAHPLSPQPTGAEPPVPRV